MKKELQQKLIKKYPHFFDDIGDRKIYTREFGSINDAIELTQQEEVVLPIQFGFECGDGWYALLDELMSSITNYIKWNSPDKDNPIEVRATQIKEKFGGLRFYINGGDRHIDGMISFAENMSYRICETCGTTVGVGQTKGWVYTICWDCLQKNERAQNMQWVSVDSDKKDEDQLL